MAEAALLVVLLLVGIGGTLLLYLLIERETDGSREMSRAEAESYARDRSSERYDGCTDEHERK